MQIVIQIVISGRNTCIHYKGLSLYSTATQNYWGSPNAKICTGDTKICLTHNAKIKFVFPPTQTPNANQWNIGCFGSPTPFFCVGHVHLIFVHFDFIRIGSRFLSGIWALEYWNLIEIQPN